MPREFIGGKAIYLEKLKKAGYKIPPFFVLMNIPKNEEDLLDIILKELPDVNYFAVRSSAEVEDSQEKSFAGHFYSAIGVSKDTIFKEVEKVINSYEGINGSVIIQQFIPSDKAGVIFSDAGNKKVVINSNLGLCDTVVKGMVCDEYILDDKNLIVSKHISKNKEAHFFLDGQIKIDKNLNQESLNTEEIGKLTKLSKLIEKYLERPQDIEWCFHNDDLYILQSRPITREIFDKELLHFDSANIAESYSGIVLPLTCSFAASIYKAVYEDLMVHSGVSREKVLSHIEIFGNMIGFFYGRMYYNMNNWYKMTAFIPGYNRNKKNLESMITSNITTDINRDIFPNFWLKIKYPFLFIFKLLLLPFTIRSFRRNVARKIKEANLLDINNFTFNQCKETYTDLSSKLLSNWYITVENDFMVMTYFGILKKVYGEDILRDLISFKSASSKQIVAISKLATITKSIQMLWSFLQNKKEGEFYQELRFYPDVKKEIDNYYEKYGGRFANELKLESTDLQEDFSKFSQIINLYSEPVAHNHQTRHFGLPGGFLKRFLMRIVLRKFKKHSSQREELRLLRSNSFDIVRKLFKRVGVLLSEKEIIQNSSDIFYLKIDEILEHNRIDQFEKMSSTISIRKIEYQSYKDVKPLSHFSIYEGEIAPLSLDNKVLQNKLSGRPCTSGTIRGKVRIFKDFFIPDKIDFDIIVASHTDPGWTALIGISKGLIIEHGGILSHASIVSRELGIPTVIGVENALEILKDGQLVEINGSTGIITVI